MSDPNFIHLHVHSHFSLLDGCVHHKHLVKKAKDLGMPALALTDHGNMFGAVEFYLAATAENIKPILGMEAYVAQGDRREKDVADGLNRAKSYHLSLLAKNNEGYQNLIKLSSMAYIDGFYRKPRIDLELIKEYSSGLVAMSGCLGGYVPQMIMSRNLESAKDQALLFKEIFGADSYYLELMRNGVNGQEEVNQSLLELSKKTQVPVVATNDIHYLERKDAIVHEVMTCIHTGQTLKDEKRMKMETDQFYFRSAQEMAELFHDTPQAIENTLKIASMCDVNLTFNDYHLPEFHPETGEEPVGYLKKLCMQGAKKLYGEISEEIQKRINYELDVIISMGFPTYFLIVWDFIRYARENNIPVGPGRGSAAGSIVAYCLGITEVDPLKYDLIFERFLNSSRVSMPDIDIDFCRDGREKVIKYVQDKYGASNVCQIVTFGTMKARAAIRDAGRVLDIDLPTVDQIAKKIPSGPKATIQKGLEEDPELEKIRRTDEVTEELFDISLKIEGLNRHSSTHAAGVVITDKPLTEYVPLCRVQGEVNTQYQMTVLEMIGLLKMDFLGLKNLTIMDKAVALIKEHRNIDIDLSKVPLDDPKAFELLQNAHTAGIFQLESDGMKNLLIRLKPDVFEDIIALLALYRPGPLESGMVDSYVKRKHGFEPVDYLDDSLEDILKETYGVIVYQEQVMRISNVLADFSMNEADSLRKAMGKKKKEVMAKFRSMFVEGAAKKGVDPKKATYIYDMIEFFAGYGFNKSHSTAYGVVTYQTAFLKANYPVEYMSALMTCDSSVSDKIAEYLQDCSRMGIKVLSPDYNESVRDFSPTKESAIRFGLGAIKGIGDKAIESIVETRTRLGGFKSIQHMLSEVDLKHMNKSVFEALVKAGAFDSTGLSRASCATAMEGLLRWAANTQADRRSGQKGLFGGGHQLEMLKIRDMEEWEETHKLSMEKEVLGFIISSDPLKKYANIMKYLSSFDLEDKSQHIDGAMVTVAGTINNLKISTIKNGRNAGKKMALFKIRTNKGLLSAVVFVKEYEEHIENIRDDRFCVFKGALDLSRDEQNPSIKITSVGNVEETLQNNYSSMILRLGKFDRVNEEKISQLKTTAAEFPGKMDLILCIDSNQRKPFAIKANPRYRINLGESSVLKFEEVVGRGNIELR